MPAGSGAIPNSGANYDAKLAAVERLVTLFRLERLVYLIITSVSLVMLLGSATILLFDHKQDQLKVLIALFGSSGLITYSLGRLLKMWDQAVDMLTGSDGNAGK